MLLYEIYKIIIAFTLQGASLPIDRLQASGKVQMRQNNYTLLCDFFRTYRIWNQVLKNPKVISSWTKKKTIKYHQTYRKYVYMCLLWLPTYTTAYCYQISVEYVVRLKRYHNHQKLIPCIVGCGPSINFSTFRYHFFYIRLCPANRFALSIHLVYSLLLFYSHELSINDPTFRLSIVLSSSIPSPVPPSK